MADLSQTIAIVFQGKDQASDEIAKVERGLKSIETTSKETVKFTDSLDGVASKIGGIGTAIAAAFAGFSVAQLAREFIDANVQLERFSLSVSAITGNGQSAGEELGYLREVSDRLGLSVRDTSGAYVSLLAATKGTNLEGQQTRAIFESVANAMALLGRSSSDTEGALLAIQQIISKGKVSAEELRGQLGERLPGAFSIAARAVGVTTAELSKMLETGNLLAEDFIPKFAKELNNTFGDPQRVDSYTAAVNRLGNAFQQTLQDLGQRSGGLGSDSIDLLGRAVRTVGLEVENQIGSWRNLRDVIRGGSWDTFIEQQKLLGVQLEGTAAIINLQYNEALAESARLLRQNAEAAAKATPDQFEAETARIARNSNLLTDQMKAEAEALKVLKVNREEVNRSTRDYALLIEQIGRSKGVTDSEFLSGIANAAKQIDGTKESFQALKAAIGDGAIDGNRSAETLAKAFKIVEDAAEKASKGTDKNTEAIQRQAKEAEKAAEKAQQWRLELEKLVSNERIKTLEFKANLDIANVQEQTKRIQAAFESLDNTVNSTADVINKAFGLLAGGGDLIDSSVRNKLFAQLDIENANRDQALRLQAELTAAQIKVLNAQAEQLTRGDALIKIDGAGLQPHLEAFMWEVLKAVQVRANRDGMKLLLGV